MEKSEKTTAWLDRVEELINVLEGSTISELELSESGTEITIHRNPGMVMMANPAAQPGIVQLGIANQPGRGRTDERSVDVITPLTGVYYSSPSPTSPPFVSIGDVIHAGQVIALVEAMKVFNEVQAEISGRVTKFVATTGEVVQKGSVLFKIEPL